MLTTLSEHFSFGGKVGYYQHASSVNTCDMTFAVFTPPQAADKKVPVLYYLAGLTCTHETFMIKAGAQQYAAQYGIMLVAPDTSPRGESVPDDGDWDLGQGAGFYIDAQQSPWNKNFQMYSYVTAELPDLIKNNFAADTRKQSIFGHSMGGHGALTIALKNPGAYLSVSAFAPICAPMQCPWGQKVFTAYLGKDQSNWQQHDATSIVKSINDVTQYPEILIDQGLSDQFLELQLYPHLLQQAAHSVAYPLSLNQHANYDHSYFFIASMMEKHIRHHASKLNN